MKSSRFISLVSASLLVVCCVALPLAHGAGAVNTKTDATDKGKGKGKGKGAAETNAANATLPIPVSAFDVTVAPTKDPFFPNSLRRPIQKHTDAKVAPGITANSFQLMALSGSDLERLAMINHRTGAVGEALEVTTTMGTKVSIRLVQIKETSVVIRVIVPPQPDLIEISLSKRAQ